MDIKKNKNWNPNKNLDLLGTSFTKTEIKKDTVHGLYATKYGVGGVTPIQLKFTSDKNVTTGRLGETMQESVKVAEQVACDRVNVFKK